MLTPSLKGFQLLGTDPGTATSEVLTTPDNLLTIVLESFSVKSPATNKSPKDSITPQVTVTGFLDCIVTLTISPTVKPPITSTVVFVDVSVYISN